MQGMIMHHAQAVVMAQLVPSRSSRDDMRTLAKRIDISQRDEIKMMQTWLKDRHQDPGMAELDTMSITMDMMVSAGHMKLMPGMLTHEQLRQLAAAKGAAFDSLFLNGMIRHHQGALQMVAELREVPGAMQDAATFAFASDVDAVQRAEIRAMSAMLRK